MIDEIIGGAALGVASFAAAILGAETARRRALKPRSIECVGGPLDGSHMSVPPGVSPGDGLGFHRSTFEVEAGQPPRCISSTPIGAYVLSNADRGGAVAAPSSSDPFATARRPAMQSDQIATADDLRADRAMDQGFVAPRAAAARGRLSPESIEAALGRDADMLLDWLEARSYDSWSSKGDADIRSCTRLIMTAVKLPGGQARRTSLKAAIDATRRCFSNAPRTGELDAWC